MDRLVRPAATASPSRFFREIDIMGKNETPSARCHMSSHDSFWFVQGDYSFVGGNGRENHVIDLGDFVLTFWTDHAAQMVRILKLERAP